MYDAFWLFVCLEPYSLVTSYSMSD